MYKNDDLWNLMAKCAFNEASGEEQSRLQAYLKDDMQLQMQYERLLQVLRKELAEEQEEPEHEQKTFSRILARVEANPQSRGGKRRFLMAAAALLTGFGIFFFSADKKNGSPKPLKSVIAKSVHQKPGPSLLPDGTKVWLNAGSELLQENDFTGKTREVRLVGEAYFDVQRNESKPFIVHINNINIRVLGTAFNVKGYEEDREVQTTLFHGLVQVTRSGRSGFQPIMLYPNQKLTIPKADSVTGDVLTKDADIKAAIAISLIDSTIAGEQRAETAWMYGRLEFDGEPLEEVARKMERWYGKKIIFADDQVKRLNFKGSFEKETPEQALQALKTANPFTYKINSDEIIISTAK